MKWSLRLNWGLPPSGFRQLMRYGLVGGLATLTHIAVGYALFAGLHIDAILANFGGFGAGFAVSLLGHARFTFGSTGKLYIVALKWFGFQLASQTAGGTLIHYFVTELAVNALLAFTVVVGVLAVLGFVIARRFIFTA